MSHSRPSKRSRELRTFRLISMFFLLIYPSADVYKQYKSYTLFVRVDSAECDRRCRPNLPRTPLRLRAPSCTATVGNYATVFFRSSTTAASGTAMRNTVRDPRSSSSDAVWMPPPKLPRLVVVRHARPRSLSRYVHRSRLTHITLTLLQPYARAPIAPARAPVPPVRAPVPPAEQVMFKLIRGI